MSQGGEADTGDWRDCPAEYVRAARRILGRFHFGAEDTKDLAGEAVARLFETVAKEPVAKPYGFLKRTATNLALDRLRKKDLTTKLRQHGEASAPGAAHPELVEELVVARRMMDSLFDEAGLDKMERWLFTTHRILGWSLVVLADRLQMGVDELDEVVADVSRRLIQAAGATEDQAEAIWLLDVEEIGSRIAGFELGVSAEVVRQRASVGRKAIRVWKGPWI